MPSPRPRHALGVALALALAACGDSSTMPLAPEMVPERAAAPIIDLNPQPEPPSLELQFTMTPDGASWFGTISVGGRACGSVQLNPQPEPPSRQTGVVTHVAYSLSIQGDDPAFLLDADLSGIVAGGHVVLNGRINNGAYAGQTIHPRGDIAVPPPDAPLDLSTTLTGALKLNPQPEPPAPEYPPSPCVAG